MADTSARVEDELLGHLLLPPSLLLPVDDALPGECDDNLPSAAAPLSSSIICLRWRQAEWAEVSTWNRAAWPIGVGILLRNAVPLTDLIILGHLGTTALAGASLAQIWIIVTSAWTWKCVGGTVNTLCSSAAGAGNFKLVGVWLQISLLCVTVAAIPIAASWWATGDVLRLLGFPTDQCDLASQFARWYTLSLWPGYVFICISNWLQSGGSYYPVLFTNLAIVCLNVALNVVLVWGTPLTPGLGFIGSPIASSISSGASALLILAFTACSSSTAARRGWSGWSREALDPVRLYAFLSMALPSGLGNLLEDGQLQVMAFLAGRLGTAEIATHSAFVSFFVVCSCLLLGAVKATTIRIGHHLGARNIAAAKFVARLDLMVSLSLSVTVGIIILAVRSDIGKIFSNDAEVWALAATIAVPVGLGYIALALFYVAMAVLQGQGRTPVILVAFVTGAWAVAVPLALYWTYGTPRGLLGLWDALVAGYATITLIAATGAVLSDWPALADAAVARSQARQQQAQLTSIVEGEGWGTGMEEGAVVDAARLLER